MTEHEAIIGRRLSGSVLLLVVACGKGAGEPARQPAASADAPDKLREMKAFDAQGQERSCEAPASDCPKAAVDADFKDDCRKRGYRVVRCGCEDLCSGKIVKQEKFYDASGNERSCAAEQPGCTPPETSAAFQDACTDGGNKLVVCGCEWLCNGPLRAASGAPPQ